jgi:hypothetical protein
VTAADSRRKHEESVSAPEKHKMSQKDADLQARLRLVGVGILVVGLLAATAVDLMARSGAGGVGADTKNYEYQMEFIGGKSNLLASEITDWFSGLWHGRKLAQTLAFLSVVGSLACFFVAHRLNYAPAPNARAGGRDA